MPASSSPTRQDSHQELPGFMATPPAPRTRGTGMLAWLFGSPRKEEDFSLANMPLPPAASEPALSVEPPQPPDSNCYWIETFFNAVTDAATKFTRRHVALLHREDPSTVYAVREIKIECKAAPAQFQRDLSSLPQAVFNRVMKNRVKNADGVNGMLVLDDYYGSTLVTDITLVEGQVVQTLVSYSGARFELKFAFQGDYITRPETPEAPAAEPEPVVPPSEAVKVDKPAAVAADAGKPATADATATGRAGPYFAPGQDFQSVRGTMLRTRPPLEAVPGVQHTVLRTLGAPAVTPLAMLRLRSLEQEVAVPLLEDNFPYTIGRHASFSGYGVRGQQDVQSTQLLHEKETADFVSFVSRDHIVLGGFDPVTRQFRVVAAKGRNGSFFKDAAMPSHFLLPMAEMARGHWLKLGGTGGDGILELRIEAV